MKRLLYFLVFLTLLPEVQVRASLKVSIPEISAASAQTIEIPIVVEGDDEFTAIQFDIYVDDKIIIDTDHYFPTDRKSDHIVVVDEKWKGYHRCMYYSPTNSLFRGKTGTLLKLKATVDPSCVQGNEYPLTLNNVVATRQDATECQVEAGAGIILISHSPDLSVGNVNFDKVSISPGEELICTWDVTNVGTLDSRDGFREQIYITDANGNTKIFLGTSSSNSSIKIGTSLPRSLAVKIPDYLGVEGACRILVKIIPFSDSGESESTETNNSSYSTNLINVARLLYLTSPSITLQEKGNSYINFTVGRSGDRTESQKIYLNLSDEDSRVSIPEALTIPEGQWSVNGIFKVQANGKHDISNRIILQASAEGYEQVGLPITIIDDTPGGLKAALSSYDLHEGQTYDCVVTLPHILDYDAEILVTSDSPKKLSIPDRIIIPAGDLSAHFSILAIDNAEAELESSATILFACENMNGVELDVSLMDDDMPTLELTFSPDIISESDGQLGVLATLTRLDNVDKEARIRLSHNGGDRLSLSNQNISMPKGRKSVEFMIRTVDNAEVDGDQKFTITAAVYSSPCNCYANNLSGGFITKEITVTDDDGPHLSLTPSSLVFKEGNSGYQLTVRRNIEPVEPLIVKLSSDSPGVVEFPETVEIPSGMKEISVKVDVPKNDIQDDSSIVSFKAEAEGLSPGSCRVSITDSTLPDAVMSIQLADSDRKDMEFKAGEKIDLIVSIGNHGVVTLPEGVKVNLIMNGASVRTLTTTGPVDPGQTLKISAEGITLPAKICSATITGRVNSDNVVKELSYLNNDSRALSFNILPSFHAVAVTDRIVYEKKGKVEITGSTDSEAGRNTNVEIRIKNGSNVFKALTQSDEKGDFTYVYNLLKEDLGHFTVSAGFPGDNSAPETASFDVNGLTSDKFQSITELGVGESEEIEISITNKGNLDYTGIRIIMPETSSAVKITTSSPSGIKAGASATVKLRISGKSATEGIEFEKIPMTITCAEGAEIPLMAYVYVYEASGTLSCNVTDIAANVTLGSSLDYPIELHNIGKGETGTITFSLPGWIETITPKEIPSLKQGETATAILRFNSVEDMELNLARSGKLAINCSKGNGLTIPFKVTPVTDELAMLKVDATDEFTYYSEEKPHLSWATVSLIHPTTGEVIDKGFTGSDGIFATQQIAGHYLLSVTAPNHSSYSTSVFLNPGETLEHEAFLPYNAVSYEWDVVETEVEDEYMFETTAKFNTSVPKPMLEISLPQERPDVYDIIPVTVENKGIIGMDNVEVSVELSEGYRFEWQDESTLPEIKGGETAVFYGRLLPEETHDIPTRSLGETVSCIRMKANAKGRYKCDRHIEDLYYSKDRSYGSCIDLPLLSTGTLSGTYDTDNGNAGASNLQPSHVVNFVTDLFFTDNQVTKTTSNPKNFCDKLNPNAFGDSGEHNNDPFGEDYFNYKDPANEWIEKDIDGEPQRQFCNEAPVLKYKLVPTSGKQYSLKGLTADGSSQLRIALDTKNSLIPNLDGCFEMTECSWQLSKDIGTIEGSDFMEAIYTAPDDFIEWMAEEGKYVIRNSATFHCKLRGETGVINYVSEPVEIKIFRPAILLVHGLGDTEKCWEDLNNDLLQKGYLPEFIYRVDYKAWNTSKLTKSVNVIPEGINTLRLRGLENGIYIGKVDIVAHSIGGLLARIYAQHSKENADRINRLITVNTPHSGSEIANTVLAHPIFGGSFAALWYSATNGELKFDYGIYEDIAVDSEAILSLNYAGSQPQIPVFATGTETFGPVATFAANVIVSAGGIVVKNALKASSIFTGPLGFIAGLGVEYVSHYLDDLLQSWPGDFIVGSDSQSGGCEASSLIGAGMMHPWSSSDQRLLSLIEDKLKDYKKSEYSTNWFNPEPRRFWHTERMVKQAIMIPMKDELAFKIDVTIAGNELRKEEIDRISDRVMDMMSSKLRVGEADSEKYEFRTVKCNYNPIEGYSDYMAVVNIGDDIMMIKGNEFEFVVPNYYEGGIRITVLMKGRDGEIYYRYKDVILDSINTQAVSLESEDLYLETGQNVNPVVYCNWADTTQSRIEPDNIVFTDNEVAEWRDGKIVALQPGTSKATINYRGISQEITIKVFGQEISKPSDNSDAICSTVTLSFKQTMVMTRQGFTGSFKLKNGHTSARLRDFRLNLEITDEAGFTTTRREFETTLKSMTGFHGDLDLNSGWTLEPGQDGTAEILFIPSKYAAPYEQKKYNFGGSFSYIDPATGLRVTHQLNPVTLTVNPSPILTLDYFLQRDVIADDPLTSEITERSEPAEFALVISNKGYGDANNLRFMTQQPQVIDNEKGLVIDLEIESSQLNGGVAALSFGESITNDFGKIAAGQSAYAQWWLRSSLPGYFSNYETTSTHLTSYGNPDLSLVESVNIHELIHGFGIDKDSEIPVRGFLVNDDRDPENTPDHLYFSDGGETESVGPASNINLTPEGLNTYQLTFSSICPGWTYGVINDPTKGRGNVISVTRVRDGAEIQADNFWTTDRTFVNGHDPIYENRLHFIIDDSTPSAYVLRFADRDDSDLDLVSMEPVYTELSNNERYVSSVRLHFTQPITPESLTSDDVSLRCDGKVVNIMDFFITSESEETYLIDLGKSASSTGLYTFSVDLTNIYDTDGKSGIGQRSINWNQDKTVISGIGMSGVSNSIHIGPNPMDTLLYIDGDFTTAEYVAIVNSLGEMKYNAKDYPAGTPIDVSDWEPGFYVLYLSVDGRPVTFKCIKK